tara:strand:+ start:552 stop:2732 length:2181 start_codon:yes stop_codon:yes gene_type:complete
MTHALRAKTFDTLILENTDVNEYLFPEIFNNTTPDLVMVQSCGRRKDDSEPDVGRNSVRVSKAWITPSQSMMAATMIDNTQARNAHSEVYGYWNLPAPISDDGDGVRTSRGWIEIIQNGIRVTNDSQYTTENHQLTITIMGGTDITGAYIKKVDQDFGSGDVDFDSRIYPTISGTNLIIGESYGGPADTENLGFLDGSSLAHVWRNETSTTAVGYVNRAYRLSHTYYADRGGFDGRGEDGWYLQDSAQATTRYSRSTGWSSRDVSQNKISDIAGQDNGQDNTSNVSWYSNQILRNSGAYGAQYLDPAHPEGAEYFDMTRNNDLPVSTYGTPLCGMYILMLAMKTTGSGGRGDNIGVWCTSAGNPYGYSNRWTGTSNAGDPTGARVGSTKGWPNEKTPYAVGGAQDTINHWPVGCHGGDRVHRMTEMPITVGFFGQFSEYETSGLAAARFQYDGRRGIDTSSNSGNNPTTGAGVGYAIMTREASNTSGGGYPETYKFVNPQFYNIQTSWTNPEADWTVGNNGLPGELQGVDDTIYVYARETNKNTSAGGAEVALSRAYSNATGGRAYVTWDSAGVVDSVVVTDSGDSTGYALGMELYLLVTTGERETTGSKKQSYTRVNVWADKVDGQSMNADGGRVKYDRSMSWGADGELILTQDQNHGVYDSYGLYSYEMHLILSASDGSGTGDDQGGNGGGIGNGIFYGSIPVTDLYYGSTPVPRVAYNSTEII